MKTKNKRWKKLLGRWYFKIATLALALIALASDLMKNETLKPVNFTFSMGVILAVVLLTLEQLFETDEQLVKLNELVSSRIKYSDILEAAYARKGIVGNTLHAVHNRWWDTLTTTPDGFRVANHALALSSYVEFWEHLVKEQKALREKKKPGLTVLVVHANAMNIWQDESLKRAIDEQANFIHWGGVVRRILCGQGEQPSSLHLEIAAAMKSKARQIEILYYNLDNQQDGPQNEWDFLLVQPEDEAVIWNYFPPTKRIVEAHYTRNPVRRNVHLADTWELLALKSTPL